MAIVVQNRKVRVASRKVRLVADLLRHQKVKRALEILRFNQKQEISLMLTKLINSGLAIAVESEKYDLDNLVVRSIFVNDGPSLKRVQPRAQGRAFRIRKRTSHVTVALEEA